MLGPVSFVYEHEWRISYRQVVRAFTVICEQGKQDFEAPYKYSQHIDHGGPMPVT